MAVRPTLIRPTPGSVVQVCVLRPYGVVVTTLRVTHGVVWQPPASLWLVGEELLADGTWSPRSILAGPAGIVIVELGGAS